MNRTCVKCGRQGTRGFAIRRGRGDKDDYTTIEEWECASRSACEKRQAADPQFTSHIRSTDEEA